MLQDLLITHARITASTILGAVKSLVLQLEGLLDDTAEEEPMYSALGVIARPRPPVAKADATVLLLEGECEAKAIKDEDGLAPFAYRDIRINQRCPSPNEGDVFLAGYQGGYVSIRAATGNLGSVVRLHAPRLDGSTGSETLAHSLVLDPHSAASPAIALTHGSGYSIRITNAGDTEVRNKLVVAPDSAQLQVVIATGDFTAWVTSVTTAVNAIIALLTVVPAGTPVVTVAPAGLPVVVPPSTYQTTKITTAA